MNGLQHGCELHASWECQCRTLGSSFDIEPRTDGCPRHHLRLSSDPKR